MQDTNLIASDLRMCLMEGKLHYDFLNIYRGVQFISTAELESVFEDRAIFNVQTPSAVLIDRDKTSIVLSNGLMDPFIIRVADFDIQSGHLEVTDMVYSGDTVGNRHEHRVEIEPPLSITATIRDHPGDAEMIDISLSGAGLNLPITVDEKILQRGATVVLDLDLPEGQTQVTAEILRYKKYFSHYWLALKFTDMSSGKVPVMRYINRSLGEVRIEVQRMYKAALQQRAG